MSIQPGLAEDVLCLTDEHRRLVGHIFKRCANRVSWRRTLSSNGLPMDLYSLRRGFESLLRLRWKVQGCTYPVQWKPAEKDCAAQHRPKVPFLSSAPLAAVKAADVFCSFKLGSAGPGQTRNPITPFSIDSPGISMASNESHLVF